jgi:hypothetical protein
MGMFLAQSVTFNGPSHELDLSFGLLYTNCLENRVYLEQNTWLKLRQNSSVYLAVGIANWSIRIIGFLNSFLF